MSAEPDDLPVTLEIWDDRDAHVERVLARCARADIGRGAFDIAVQEFPEKIITLRHKARVVAEHKPTARSKS
jgi:hypothetical protein